jgi:hypothetical protein
MGKEKAPAPKRWVRVPKSLKELKQQLASDPNGRLVRVHVGDKRPKGYKQEVFYKLMKSKR